MTYRKPLSIRIVCFVMSIVMVLLCLNDWNIRSGAEAEPLTIKIIDEHNVTHEDAKSEYGATVVFDGLKINGKPVSENQEVKDGDVLSFSLSWDAGTFETEKSDGTSEFIFVVDNLKKCKNVEPYLEPTTVERDSSVADYEYDPVSGKIMITVQPTVGHDDDFRGSCDVSMVIRANADGLEDGKIDLNPIFDLSYTYVPGSLSVGKASSGNMYKSGDSWYQDYKINLTVTNGSTMRNVKVTDTFDADVFIGSPENLKLNGEPITSSGSGNTFVVEMPTLSGSNELTYSLRVDPDSVINGIVSGDPSVSNDVVADYNNYVEDKQVSANSSIWLSGPTTEKSGSYNESTKQITWRVTFKPGIIGTLTDGDISTLSVTDTVGKNLDIEDLKTALDEKGISYTVSGDKSVVIGSSSFIPDGNGNYYIEYTTPAVDDDIITSSDPKVENKAKSVYKNYETYEAQTSVPVNGSVGTVGSAYKELASADPDSYTMKWNADILIPETDDADRIEIEDGAVLNEYSPVEFHNVALLKTDISGFTFTVDGNSVPIASYIVDGSLKYRKVNQWYGLDDDTVFDPLSDAGFRFSINTAALIADHPELAGKTLRISYDTVMGGDLSGHLSNATKEFFRYRNSITANYYKGNVHTGSNTDDAEYAPYLSAKKLTNNGDGLVEGYGNGGDFPVLAFWEVRLEPKSALESGKELTVIDTVSAGNKYYPGSVSLVCDDNANDYYARKYNEIPDSLKFDSRISASAADNVTTFTITVDESIADAAARGYKLRIFYATAPSDEEVSKAVNYGEEINVSNNADVYYNDTLQAKHVSASQKLTPAGEICGKTQQAQPGSSGDAEGSISYTVTINEPAAKLSDDGIIIVDDWLGGNIDIKDNSRIKIEKKKYDEDTTTTIWYDVVKNPDYNKEEGTVRNFFYLDGVKLEDSKVIKTGVGTKMRFVLEDRTSYKITYECTYEKMQRNVYDVEETARYSNTVVIHNSSKTLQSCR